MQEHQLEQLLRRYRPAGPTPDLRGRIFSGRAGEQRVWPWAAVAAALLTVVVVFQSATTRVSGQMSLASGSDVRAREIETLAEMLGGGRDARAMAELMILMQEAHALGERTMLEATGFGDPQ